MAQIKMSAALILRMMKSFWIKIYHSNITASIKYESTCVSYEYINEIEEEECEEKTTK